MAAGDDTVMVMVMVMVMVVVVVVVVERGVSRLI